MVHDSRLVASKAIIDGYGLVRRHSVYSARRYLSSPALVCQSRLVPKAAVSPLDGCGGFTLSPYILRLNSPDTARAWSRTISAVRRTRGPRLAKRFSGSRANSSGVTLDDCR